jgi:CBS domain-containing protein
MTSDPITATADTSAEEAGRTMLEHGFRHLPVVEGERAIGIVSIRDLVEERLGHSH